jgi:hypothetical protein
MGISLTGLTPSTTYDALIKVGDNGPIDGTLKTLSDGLGNDLPMEVSTTGVNLTGSPTVNAVAIANTTQVAAKQDTLVSGTNIKTINGASVLGSGNIPVVTSPSGVAGAIQFSNGSAFASDAANFFWDDTNNRMGVGTNAPINNLTIIDSTTGSTSGAKGITVGNSHTANALSFGSYFNVAVISGPTGPLMLQTPAGNKGVSISTGYLVPTAMAHIQGSGSTSATTSLLVQNSAGNSAFAIKDDRTIDTFANTIGNQTWGQTIVGLGASGEMRLQSGGGAGFFMTFYTSGAEAMRIDAQRNVGINTLSANNTSAILQVDSTTKGVLFPRMTTTQKNAIASPATGLVLYDSTTNKLQCYNGSTWNDLF